MNGYGSFGQVYDRLNCNVSYPKLAAYFDGLVKSFGGKRGILLDLACGTGSLSEEMSRLGYDVIGTDISLEMLNAAMEKKLAKGLNIQYICQNMTELDMYGTVDVTVCASDSLNHLESIEQIRQVFERVALFSEPGGLFLFDVNTPYKHRTVLGSNTFVYDLNGVYCVWQNYYNDNSPDHRVDITLDIFTENPDGSYKRDFDSLSETAYEREVIERELKEAGFEVMAVYDYFSTDPPREDSEKLIFAAVKK